MKKNVLLITALVLVAVLAVAGVLYSRLGTDPVMSGLAVADTSAPAETAAPTETTAPAEETTEPAEETTEPAEETTAPAEETEPHLIPAWDFTVIDADGNEAKLSDYFGKPIVLNFWTHWCSICQSEMPGMNAKYEQLGGEVVFLMIHVGEGMEIAKEQVAQNGYTFPVLYDTERVAAAGYGVNSYPITFFIDSDGNLQAYHIGAMGSELLQRGVDLIYTPNDQETVKISENQ